MPCLEAHTLLCRDVGTKKKDKKYVFVKDYSTEIASTRTQSRWEVKRKCWRIERIEDEETSLKDSPFIVKLDSTI